MYDKLRPIDMKPGPEDGHVEPMHLEPEWRAWPPPDSQAEPVEIDRTGFRTYRAHWDGASWRWEGLGTVVIDAKRWRPVRAHETGLDELHSSWSDAPLAAERLLARCKVQFEAAIIALEDGSPSRALNLLMATRSWPGFEDPRKS